MTDYLVYWRMGTAEHYGGTHLNHAASDQFGRVSRGDRLWIITAKAGDLQLLGRINVAEVTGQKEAQAVFGQLNLWKAKHHVIADMATMMPLIRLSIRDLAPKLRFIGTTDRLTIRQGKVNAQELQTIRRLDLASADLLATRLGTAGIEAQPAPGKTMDTLAHLEVGTVYSRKELAARFAITDATINNGVFRPKGHNSIWLFITKNKTSDRTPYTDHLDGDTLRFDGQTKGGTDRLLMDHPVLGLDILLFYRERKDAYAGYGFRFEGNFRYLAHERDRPKHFTFVRVTSQAQPESIERFERVISIRTSQGFVASPAIRRALETYSMTKATEYFKALGYSVSDVHATKPVDLICKRGPEILHVEVKCTQTTGEEILLTSNEVEYARTHRGKMMLFILHSVDVGEGDDPIEVRGGEERVLDWNVDDGQLSPLCFRYRVPIAPGAIDTACPQSSEKVSTGRASDFHRRADSYWDPSRSRPISARRRIV